MRTRSVLILAVLGGTGCGLLDRALEVEAPSRVVGSKLDDPIAAPLLVASVGADFECAFSRYILAGGLLGDELGDATLSTSLSDFDARRNDPSGGLYATQTCSSTQRAAVYKTLSTARWQADDVRRLLNGWTDAQVPNRGSFIATTALYAGYSLVLLGEGMCSAAIDVGPELTSAQVLAEAESRFDEAIGAAGPSDADLRSAALVGRARARLGLGRAADAAADAAQVPAGFVFDAHYSSVSFRTENTVFVVNDRRAEITVEPSFRGVSFQGTPDPRVPVVDAGRGGSDASVPLWLQRKYPSATSPIPIATWEEAQLIQAEAALEAGDLQAAVGFINALHANAGIPNFSSSDAAAIRNRVIEERRIELFLESHRLGDLRRYDIPLAPPAGVLYRYGGAYGDQRCFPFPDIERNNNPNTAG